MKRVTRNEVDISDIFYFAKEKFNKGWNACCDLFQGADEVLPFIGTREFYLEELEYEIEHIEEEMSKLKGEQKKTYKNTKFAYEILVAFMKHNKVKKMYYVGTGN